METSVKIRTTNHGAYYTTAGRRCVEWSAIDEDGAPARSPTGLGETEDEAIYDLMEQLRERSNEQGSGD